MNAQKTTNKGEGLALACLYNLLTNPKMEAIIRSTSVYHNEDAWNLLIERGYIFHIRLIQAHKISIIPENMKKIESKIQVEEFNLDYTNSLLERGKCDFEKYQKLLFR